MTTTQLIDNADFQRAVRTARENIPIQEKVVIESARTPYVISRRVGPTGSERFEVLHTDAWVPHTGSILGWGEPSSYGATQVARVGLDGSITMIEDDELVRQCEDNADFVDAVTEAQASIEVSLAASTAIVMTSYPSGDATFEVVVKPTSEQLASTQVPAGDITRRVVVRVDRDGTVKSALA